MASKHCVSIPVNMTAMRPVFRWPPSTVLRAHGLLRAAIHASYSMYFSCQSIQRHNNALFLCVQLTRFARSL